MVKGNKYAIKKSIWVAEEFANLTLDYKVLGLNPARGRVQLMTVLLFIA